MNFCPVLIILEAFTEFNSSKTTIIQICIAILSFVNTLVICRNFGRICIVYAIFGQQFFEIIHKMFIRNFFHRFSFCFACIFFDIVSCIRCNDMKQAICYLMVWLMKLWNQPKLNINLGMVWTHTRQSMRVRSEIVVHFLITILKIPLHGNKLKRKRR